MMKLRYHEIKIIDERRVDGIQQLTAKKILRGDRVANLSPSILLKLTYSKKKKRIIRDLLVLRTTYN